MRLLHVLVAFAVLSSHHVATAKDKLIGWTFGMARGGTQADTLQCQSVTFDWSTGDGMMHDVWEFPSEEAFVDCDFSGATKLTEPSMKGKFVLVNEDTLDVTKRWFGCKVGAHCKAGKMKVAIKIRPLLVDKFYQAQCVGGTKLIARNEADSTACRKRCKRKRGCIALEYNSDASRNCVLFSTAPERRAGRSNANAQCEIATTTCGADNSQDGGAVANPAPKPAPAPAPAPVSGPTVPCEIDMRVRCKLVRGTLVTNVDCAEIPMEGQCKVKVRYLYFVHTLKPGGTTLQSLTRSRNGASGGAEKNLLIDENGVSSVGKVVGDWALNSWEEDFVDLCSTSTYDTTVELVTKKASTGQVCRKSESVKFATNGADAPAISDGASQCKVKMDVECIVCIEPSGCGGTDCNFYANPSNGRCTLPLRYQYTFKNEGDSFFTVKSIGRTRTGESNLNLGGTNYMLPKGQLNSFGENQDFDFCKNGVKDTVFEAVVVCGGQTETFTANYKLIY